MKKHPATQLQRIALLIIAICLLENNAIKSQEFSPYQEELIVILSPVISGNKPQLTVNARATGRTTGHVINWSIYNPGAEQVELEIQPALIPSDGLHQGYIVPEPTRATIPANSTVTVPLYGFCTHPDLPPPPVGSILPEPDKWPESPFPDPAFFENIRTTITNLQENGQISTPFSGDQERAILQQQLVWYYSHPTEFDPCFQLRSTLMDWYRDTDWFSNGSPNIDQSIAQVVSAIVTVGSELGHPDFSLPSLPDFTLPITPASPTSNPVISNTVHITGTGRTTGHIADLVVSNPTKEPITIQIGNGGPMFIPSHGIYQSYVVPSIPHIPVDPGQTVTVPVEGYCADVRKPPVGADQPIPPLSEWIGTNPSDRQSPVVTQPSTIPGTGDSPREVVSIPVQTSPPLSTVKDILENLPTPSIPTNWDCPDLPPGTNVLIPETNTPVRTPLSYSDNPELAVPVIIEALERIIKTTDNLISDGAIHTPFSNSASREREAVIQQTFWIFTADLEGDPYLKDDFRQNTFDQFESSTGRSVTSIPEAQREQLDKGVDDFWNTFQAVGFEAKILPEVPLKPRNITIPQESFDMKRPLGTTSTTDIPRSPTTGPVDNPPPPIPPVPPVPPVPPEENTCQPSMRMKVEPAMDGGLNKYSVGTFLIRYNDLLPLVAEGADADEIEFWCTPDPGCPETKSYRKEGLTSRVKYRWEMIDGPGHFVRMGKDTSTTSEDKVLLWQPPNLTGTDESSVSNVTTRIRLTILDDLPGQPQDDPVVHMIEITASKDNSLHFDSIRVEVKGPVFSTYNQPPPIVETGTCVADPLKWTRTDDLKPKLAQMHSELVYSGQKIILRANDKRDPDELSLNCSSTCNPSTINITLEDEVIFDWRIIGPSDIFGYFLEGQGIRTANTWGREIVYCAPEMKSNDLRRTVMIEVLAYNQPTYPFLYDRRNPVLSKAIDIILRDTLVLEVDCRPPGFRPHSEVIIGWTDHLLDHDHPWIVETLHHVSNSVNLYVVPDACEPMHNKNLETGQSAGDGAVIIEPIRNDHDPQTDDSYIEQTVALSQGNIFMLHNYLIIIDDGFLSGPTQAQLDEFGEFVAELLEALIMISSYPRIHGNLQGESYESSAYREVSEFFMEVLSSGDIPDDHPMFQQMVQDYMDENPGVSQADAMADVRAEIPYQGRGWQNHDMVKKYELGLLYSWWIVVSHPTNCLQTCPVVVDHFTWSSLGDTDHYYKRDSKILLITPAGTQAQTYSHENKGPDFD